MAQQQPGEDRRDLMFGAKKFKEVAEEYITMHKRDLRPTSYASYLHLLKKRILPALGEIRVTKITNETIQEFVNISQENGYSKHGTRDCVSIVKLVLKYGAKKGYCKESVMEVKYAREDRKKKQSFLNNEEYTKLFRFCIEHPGKRTLPTLISMTTGIRIGEVCALKYGDIDFDKATINIERSVKRVSIPSKKSFIEISDPKTVSSIRVVPILPEVLKAVESTRLADDVYISSGDNKLPLEPRSYRQKYGRLLKSLDIAPHTFHDLRHTFASRCINAGSDARTVADILGHANVEMTLNTYTHSTDERRRAVAANACVLV